MSLVGINGKRMESRLTRLAREFMGFDGKKVLLFFFPIFRYERKKKD